MQRRCACSHHSHVVPVASRQTILQRTLMLPWIQGWQLVQDHCRDRRVLGAHRTLLIGHNTAVPGAPAWQLACAYRCLAGHSQDLGCHFGMPA